MEEKEPFLGGNSIESQTEKRERRQKPLKSLIYIASTINCIILVANVLVSIHRGQNLPSSSSTCYEHFPNRISGAVASYESQPHLFTKFQDSPYTGSPSEENDEAWHDLMNDMVIRVSEEELNRGSQESLPLPNGGYMAWLGAYHELHCVKMLRQFKYADYYHAGLDKNSTEYAHLSVHADHCLEMLRASALCHADGSLTTFKWSPNAAKPMLDLTRPSHKCVNWDTLMDSVKDRVVGEEEMSKMINPDFAISTDEALDQ